MRFSILSSLLAALIASPIAVSASAIKFRVLTKAPIPPTEDPFYKAPAGFESKAPGTILRHRPVPHTLLVGPTLNPGNVEAAFQILYRTTDGLGRAQATVQTLIIPHKADTSKLLSYQTFYDAADDNCSPSYTLQQGQPHENIEGVIMSSVLRQGWILAVPDYEGPKASFTVGKQAGHATLDGIRAVLNSKSFSNISSTPKVQLFGYSGGALASEWAAELQPSYAPDLKIVGAAFGGTTPNITSVIVTVNNKNNSYLIPIGVLGFASQYANVSKFLNESLIPSKAAAFRHPLTHCSNSNLDNKNIFSYFKQGDKVLHDPILKSVVQANGIMGLTNTPKIPLYIYKSTGDEVSPIADTDKLVKKYCDHGASIRYIRNHYGDHETEFIIALPHAFRWLKQRFDGVAPPKKCSTRNEKVSTLNQTSASILGQTVYEELMVELSQMEAGL